MSLSVRPQRRTLAVRINRSQSFAGVNSTQDKGFRNLPPFSPPTVSRKPGSRVRRMFSMSHKSPLSKAPQPDRLDEVYEALKKGLTGYLEVHQLELEKLSTQIRESKRNSRLGFLYDLDKQVKSIERFLRRLEFHASKIDELYEAYCVQRRLRDGAHNMVRAYTAACPTSREARDSLAEASKGYKEYTENMCLLESELESQLGEFHVKMKGLAGFARLCAGDQYEIGMKYGRQRWKLKGRIEVNGKQVWDSEEMVFQPLVTEFLSIKVTELKSLASHVVVGSVACETKDLFAALPQVVAVDVNDLGTIKLSLEVTWNPFDKDDQPSASSTVGKAPTVSKRFSTYSQSPPDTPSLREQAFYNMLRRQEELENGTAWSISSESSDDSSSPQLSGSARHSSHKPVVQPEVQVSAPAIEIAFSQPEEAGVTAEGSGQQGEPSGGTRKEVVANGHVPYSRTLSHISESSLDAALDCREGPSAQAGELSPAPQDCSAGALPPPATDTLPLASPPPVPRAESHGAVVQQAETAVGPALGPQGCEVSPARPASEESRRPAPGPAERPKPVDCGLEEAIGSLASALDDYRGQFPELQPLEQELKRLEEILMHKQGIVLSRTSSMSLTVEHALESFSFLNASDTEEEEEEEGAGSQRTAGGVHAAAGALGGCDAPAEDAGVGSGSEGSSDPMSTGSEFLDRAVVQHLGNCNRLLLKLGTFGPLRCREMYALDKLMQEAQVLEMVCRLAEEKSGAARAAAEGECPARRPFQARGGRCKAVPARVCAGLPALPLPPVVQFSTRKEGVLAFWDRCVELPNVYTCPVERFLRALTAQYAAPIAERQPGLADAVCVKLVEDMLGRRLPKRPGSSQGEQLTLFQYWSHFEPLPVATLDAYIMELAEEVQLAQNLNSDDQDVVLKALRRVPESRLKKDGLKAMSSLLVEGNSKVVSAVSTQLRSLAENPRFRERALVWYLEQLEDEEVQTRIAGCAALGCLKAKESIEQLVYLCQADKEDVREAAKQSLMLCGEDGKSAHRRLEETLESLPRIFAPGSMASTAF
ncbi:rho family-interacting cell polarization regulator 1 isoform X2 [Carettochelys insculpta]